MTADKLRPDERASAAGIPATEKDRPGATNTKTVKEKVKPVNKKQLTVYLPDDLHKQLQSEAERRGYPMKDLIVLILWEAMKDMTRQ